MSHDCPLGIRHKNGEYIEIGGEIFLARLYLGDTHDMFFGFFGFDVFYFSYGLYMLGGDIFVFAFMFYLCFLFHIW